MALLVVLINTAVLGLQFYHKQKYLKFTLTVFSSI